VKVEPDLRTTVLGQKISMPVIAAPVGSLRLLWPRGEAVAAKAVGEAGTIVALSTLTGTRLEEVKDAAQGPCWYQLYLVGGRNAALRGIERAKEAGYAALVLTIDTPVTGNRVGHARMKPMDAISGNLKQKAKFGPQMMHHLSWLTSFKADGGAMKFANVILDDGSTMPYADIGAQLRQSAVTWEDVKWIKQAWGDRPMIIKGVHNFKDARLAEQHGASAIVISNHGGRQLDRVLPTLHILNEVAPRLQAEHSTMEILMDGGVRSGSDVVIAHALGAKAVLVGRAYAYGLGAGGEAGVKRAFDILRKEIDDTMRQLGCAKLDDLDPSKHLRPYPFSEAGAGLVRVWTSSPA
jgi:L-lactate dehydrogenase (cytochrome)